MPAGDSSPFRRICEPLLECRRVSYAAKAITDAVPRQIDVHVPFKGSVFEPFEYFHSRFIERQRYAAAASALGCNPPFSRKFA
jgi:hypothetical protein